MSPLIPAALRAPQTAPAVQGAQRATTPSGDDFARALRQESADQSAPTSRPSNRPVSRDDRSDVARETRIDTRTETRRADQMLPSDQNVSEAVDGASAQVTLAGPCLATVLLAGASALGAEAVGGSAAAGETASGEVEGIDQRLAQAAVVGAVPVVAPSGAQGEALLGSAGGASGSSVGAATPAQPVMAVAPGRHLADLEPANATAQAAQVSGQATAAAVPGPGEGVVVAAAPAPGQPGAAAIAGSTPAALPAVVPGTAISAQSDGASDSGAGGAGRAPVADGATPLAGPSPTALPGTFAHTLAGLTGVDRVTAPAATGSAAQASLAEQVRGPVLALRGAAPGEHVLTLKVTPENLGPVQVRAHIGAEGIRIELVGATDAAREGLRSLLTDLRRDLAGTGMNASLSLGGDSGTGGRAGHGAASDLGSAGGSGQSRSGRSSDSAVTREPHTAPAVPLTPTSSGAHGVDILT